LDDYLAPSVLGQLQVDTFVREDQAVVQGLAHVLELLIKIGTVKGASDVGGGVDGGGEGRGVGGGEGLFLDGGR